MANSGDLLITNKGGAYRVHVSGRATFECAPSLRNLAKKLETESFKEIRIDLEKCSWMDSTFMGILAMLALRARKLNAPIYVCNASEQNVALLCGLGLKKFFQFVTDNAAELENTDGVWNDETPGVSDRKAQTVLEAHQTLMNVDEENIKKFEKVVDMVQRDIDRMNENKDN